MATCCVQDWTAAVALLLDGCNRLARPELARVSYPFPPPEPLDLRLPKPARPGLMRRESGVSVKNGNVH